MPSHSAGVENENGIDDIQHRRLVRDDDDRGSLRLHDEQRLAQGLFASQIQMGIRFVQNEQLGPFEQSPGQADALPLSARQSKPAGPQHRIILLGRVENHLVNARKRRRFDDPFHRRIAEPGNVFAHGAGKSPTSCGRYPVMRPNSLESQCV